MATAPRFTNLAAGRPKPDCTLCPSFMRESDQRQKMGRDFDNPICARKLISIGRPGVTDTDKMAKQIAPKCGDFGKPTDIAVNHDLAVEVEVAFPDMAAQTISEPDNRVRGCFGCKNYVGPKATKEKLGWEAGFCKAKGTLLFDDRLARYAVRCEYRSSGDSGLRQNWFDKETFENWNPKLFTEHVQKIAANSPLAILKAKRDAGVDPAEYPTDKPVSSAAQALGVRAWRRIKDQSEYGADIFVPVFDIRQITDVPKDWDLEVELKKIPRTDDDERPGDYIDHSNAVYRIGVAWTKLGETPALWGPAGVGKTELFRHLAWLMQLPFERVSITGSSELDDIAGKMMFVEGETRWHNGRVSRAWAKPNVLLIDEPNVGPPDVWQFLRPLTDNSKQLVLDQNRGERIPAHKAAYLGMAMNPAWDPRNVGAMELGDADGSRLMHMHMGLPPKEIEEAIILGRLMLDRPSRLDEQAVAREEAREKEVVRILMNVAADLRKMSDDGAIPVSWGIRNQIKVARLKRYMRWPDAFRAGVVDSLEPRVAEIVLKSVTSHCPEE